MMNERLTIAVLGVFLLLTGFGTAAAQPTAVAGGAAPAAANTTGVRRELFDAAKYPALGAVGRINLIGLQWCTIVLVADDLAVTAGHCFLKANYRFDLAKDLDPSWTSVSFRRPNGARIEGVSVRRILKASLTPDYAIVRLNAKIAAADVAPLKVASPTFEELRRDEERLGCAGFNGDKELGGGGFLLTISRNVRLVPETSSRDRVDATCYATYGGSGGPFFRETAPAEAGGAPDYELIGLVWGITDEKYNERGELVKDDKIITSITPAAAFYAPLRRIIEGRR